MLNFIRFKAISGYCYVAALSKVYEITALPVLFF